MMTTKQAASPQISVVMTTYNRANIIPGAIHSILNQTFKDFELVIVNDGSSDGTQTVLEQHARKDPRIRVVFQKNRGLAGARNYGVRYAKGKYIAFMDDDDKSHPQRLEKQFEYLMQNPEKNACICLKNVNPDIVKIKKTIFNIGIKKKDKDNIKFPPFILNATTLIKKTVFDQCGGFDEFFVITEDYEFTLRFFKFFLAGLVKENLYDYTLTQTENPKLTQRFGFFISLYAVMAHIKNDVYWRESEDDKFAIEQALGYLPKISATDRKRLFAKFLLRRKGRAFRILRDASLSDHILFLFFIRQFNLMASFIFFYRLKLKYIRHYRRLENKHAVQVLRDISYFSFTWDDYKKLLSRENRDINNQGVTISMQ